MLLPTLRVWHHIDIVLEKTKSMSFHDLNQRSIDIFRHIVDAYMETGEPVGSRTLSRRLTQNLSPATIRNVMADLEDAGLLYAPHTSAGRLPTEKGLNFFVHGLLEVGDITAQERKQLENACQSQGRHVSEVLEQATQALSGLSQCASIVFAPKTDSTLRHIEFVHLAPGRVLVVLISEDGVVENRLLEASASLTPSILEQATNYLSHQLKGRTLKQLLANMAEDLALVNQQIDQLAADLVTQGLAAWTNDVKHPSLIVKGQTHLIDHATDLDHIRLLLQALEGKETLCELLDSTVHAHGIQIFIGSENSLFNMAGCSMVVAPYQKNQVVGAIGVIGPTHMNYGRIIPLVDFTSKAVERLLNQG